MEHVPIGTGPGFVGRKPEIATLLRAWDEVRRGASRVIGVDGEAGIGKTALVREFLRRAEPDTVILVSGDEAEASLPWGLADQLTAELPDAGSDQLETVLSAAAAIGDGLRGLGLAVLVVDDAHWGDPLSMTALRLAVRRLAADPVLVVLIYQPTGGGGDGRAGSPSPGLDGAWRRVFESERGAHLTVTGLPAIDLVRLAVACGHPGLTPSGAARLYEHTGGHPLHVRHLLDELPVQAITSGHGALPAPRGIATAVRPRLRQCDQVTRNLVAAGAVLGRRFRLATVRTLLDAADVDGTPDLGSAVTEAVRAGLLEEVPGSAGQQLAFTSSLVRGLVYHDIDLGQRRELHRRASTLTGTDGIWHRIAAADGPDPVLAADIDSEARAHLARGQIPMAIGCLRHALDLTAPGPARTPRLLTIVESLLAAGDVAEVSEYAAEVAQLAPGPWSDYVAGYRLLLVGQVTVAKQRLERALVAVRTQPPETTDAGPADLEGRIATQLAVIGVLTYSPSAAVEHGETAVATAREPWVAALAWYIRAIGHSIAGRTTQGLAQLSAAHTPGVPSGLDGLVARGILRMWADDLDGAERDLSDAVARAARGEPLRNGQPLGFLGEVQYRRGALAEAVLHTEAALGDAEENNRVWNLAMLHAFASYPLAAQGRFAQATHHAEQAGMWAERIRTATAVTYAAGARAMIAQARDDPAGMLAAAEQLEPAYPGGEPGTSLLAALRADALSRLGEAREASQALAVFEAKVAAVGRRSTQMSMARVRAQIAAAGGRYVDALDECRIGLGLAREIGLPLEAARIELLTGEYAAAAGRRAAAERSLRAALRQFATCGADAYVALTLAAAERVGLSLDAPPAALNLLTPAERAVATLVCRGLSNREVAQRLVLSPKTIEYHLTNVFRRLDVSTRAELREVAADLV